MLLLSPVTDHVSSLNNCITAAGTKGPENRVWRLGRKGKGLLGRSLFERIVLVGTEPPTLWGSHYLSVLAYLLPCLRGAGPKVRRGRERRVCPDVVRYRGVVAKLMGPGMPRMHTVF